MKIFLLPKRLLVVLTIVLFGMNVSAAITEIKYNVSIKCTINGKDSIIVIPTDQLNYFNYTGSVPDVTTLKNTMVINDTEGYAIKGINGNLTVLNDTLKFDYSDGQLTRKGKYPYVENPIVLTYVNHQHGNWTAEEVTGGLKLSCGNSYCTNPAYHSVLTISAIDKIYDGETTQISISTDPEVAVPTSSYTVKYYKKGTTTEVEPKNAGEYTAVLSMGEAKTSFDFKITKKNVTVTANDKGKTYGNADPELTYSNSDLGTGAELTDITVTRAEGEDIGTYTITASQPEGANSNYNITFVTGTFIISKRNVTVTADDLGKTYGDADPELTYTNTSLGTGAELTDITVTRADGEDVGTYTITASQPDGANPNYNITFVTGTFIISKRNVTVTADDLGKTYGDADPELTYSNSDLGAGVALTDITVTRAEGEDIGTYTITASQPEGANPNYNITFVTGTFIISKRNVTVTADDLGKTYGDADPELTYSNTSLGTGAELTDITVTRADGEDVGTYTITASQPEGANPNYNITFVTGTFTISKRNVTVTADDLGKTYGDADPELTYSNTDLGTGAELTDITVTRAEGEDVGEYTITASQPEGANPNYNITFETGTFTIIKRNVTVTADDLGKTYGYADPELTYSNTSLGTGAELTDITVTRAEGEDIGTYTITASQPEGANPNYNITFVTGTFIISKRNVTVTADDLGKTYGDADPELTYTNTDLGAGVALTDITVTRADGEDVGEYIITASQPEGANPNYNITFETGTFTIIKRNVTVTADDLGKTYGDADPELTYSNTDLGTGAELTDITVTRAEGEDVGTYTITASQPEGANPNYNITFVTGTFTIIKRNVTVTANDKGKTYGYADPELTYSNSDLGTGAELTDITVTRAEGEDIGTYTITASQPEGANPNYNITFVTGTFIISKRNVTVTADDLGKTYGDADPELTYSNSDLGTGAELTDITVTRADGEDVGEYIITASQPEGANPNYNITFVTGTFTIIKRNVTVTANDKGKTYGDADPELTYSNTDLGTGAELTDITVTRADGEDVGEYIITASQPEGANPNYNITFETGTFTISKRNVTVTADDLGKTYGDADPELTYSNTDLGAGVALTDITVTRAEGEDVGTYTITASQSEGANPNYNITFVTGTFTISKRNVTVTADDLGKTYGDADTELTYTNTSLGTGAELTDITVTRAEGEDVGTYTITASQSEGANPNYNITFETGTFTIIKRNVTVTADDLGKTYGDADSELTYSNTDLGAGVALTDITVTRADGEDVGEYTITASQPEGANPNYNITFETGTFTISVREVVAIGVEFQTVKMIDQTVTAEITRQPEAGNIVDGDDVTIVASAKYDNAYVGVNKDITVTYSLTGTDAFNYYLRSESELFANVGTILDYTTLAEDIKVSEIGYCPGNEAVIYYEIATGTPVKCKIEFSAEAKAQGFKDSEWTEVTLPEGSISFMIPQTCVVGYYTAKVTFRNELDVDLTTDVTFMTNVQLEDLKELFYDVIAIDNNYGYSSYQWYKVTDTGDVIIPGANMQYYQENGGLKGVYYVVVNNEYRSCYSKLYNNLQSEQKAHKELRGEVITIVMPDGTLYGTNGRGLGSDR